MKFLTFVDLHGDKKLLKKLLKRGSKEDIDFVVIAGDLTYFEKNLLSLLEKLNTLGKKVLIIPGNHEDEDRLREAVKKYQNCIEFNKKAVKIADYFFLGYGGGGFSLEDKEFRKIARYWYGEYQKEKVILVTHGPPFGTLLDRLNRRQVGNKDFRNFIERIKPCLVICGHLHERAGKKDKIGESLLVNPGKEGLIIEISKTSK